jgi:hypothetical protein
MNYKKLKDKFIKNGFNFKLLKREGDKAIYEKRKSKLNYCYEVILIARHDGYSLGENYLEPAETYPSSSQWGEKGWTFKDLNKAEEKFNNLIG